VGKPGCLNGLFSSHFKEEALMFKLTSLLRVAAGVSIGIVLFVSARPASAQGRCAGGGGGGMGFSRGGMGGGYFGGNYGGGYYGSGYTGGAWQPYGAAGNHYQNAYGSASQNSGSQQPDASGVADTSPNNPATVLAQADDLNLTAKQVQLLEKMQKSGKKRAMLILTKEQRKQLVGGSAVTRKASSS
jgi:hypothetical protein